MQQPTIVVEPKEGLADEDVKIHIYGMRPYQNITISAAFNRHDVGKFESFAHYTANHEGVADLSSQMAVGGSYSGVEPMGLFWSMQPSASNKRSQIRLVVRDVVNPITVSLRVFDLHLKREELTDCINKTLAQSSVKRWYMSPSVKRISGVRWKRVRGTLFLPKGTGQFPALIDLYGIIGGVVEFRASLLASKGYITLALPYFAYDDLPKSPKEIDLGYIEEAKEFLESLPQISRGRVGLIGNSLGGLIALACASYVPGFKCAVSINGLVFPYNSSLTYAGKRWDAKFSNTNLLYEKDGAVVTKYSCDEHYNVDRLGSSLINFAECDTPLLFIFGKDDNAINAVKAASFVDKLCRLSKSKNNYKIMSYPGAGHVLEPPHFPLFRSTYVKLTSAHHHYGGTTKEHARAQEAAWTEILKFVNEHLSNSPSRL